MLKSINLRLCLTINIIMYKPDIESSSPRLLWIDTGFNRREEGDEILKIFFRHPLELLSGVASLDGDPDNLSH